MSDTAAAPTQPDSVAIRTCQVCGSDERRLLFRDPPYEVLRCSSCTFVYLTPRLSDDTLHTVYGEDYWQSDSPKDKGYADYAGEEQLYLKTFRRRHRLVRRFIRPDARILDVGCAAGFFLRVMKEKGHEIFGAEVSEAIGATAVQHLGPDRVHLGYLQDAPGFDGAEGPFQPASFDLVTMWDVIEHVPDPQAVLAQCRKLLKPDGTLLLETQNIDSLWARLTGKRWQHFKHEEHIYHFNPPTIVRLLEGNGFDVTFETARFGGKFVSCGFIAERAQRLHPLVGLMFRPLALGGRANFYLNLRDEMIVAARPRN